MYCWVLLIISIKISLLKWWKYSVDRNEKDTIERKYHRNYSFFNSKDCNQAVSILHKMWSSDHFLYFLLTDYFWWFRMLWAVILAPETCPQRQGRGQRLLILKQIFLLAQILNSEPKHLYRPAHPNRSPIVFNKQRKKHGGMVCRNGEAFLVEQLPKKEKQKKPFSIYRVVLLCVWVHCCHF